jgi:LPXTG-motif cell wall-anchored protein
LAGRQKLLAVLLAMAMFVLVVDTSLMNVSISAVVRDLDTTVSSVQSAIALEALVSAAFILIGGKVGDLVGRKAAYVTGLLGYAVGATAMTVAQGLTAVIVFWAVVGGIGASLLLPAMQSLIHGNFEGGARKKVYALVGAAAAIAAAVGPLLGGFITTFVTWRLGFALEVVVIAVVLSGIRLVRDVPYTGARGVDLVGAMLSVLGMGGVVLGVLVWQEGGEFVGALMVMGVAAIVGLGFWLVRRKRRELPALLDPDLFRSALFQVGVSQLNNYTLSPIPEARASEAASVNSAAGSFGLSLGLALAGAVMLAALSVAFTSRTEESTVLPPADQQRVATALEHDAQVMSNTELSRLLAEQPAEIRDEIVRINTDARPIALQIALLVPLVAALAGLVNSIRMGRLPDPAPSGSGDVVLG